uniref:Uncharacterized protein n=1 Tax=virus sp. ctJrn16 TaxID=2825813 RepID=A0A8S5RKE2_9VIRU|nr:MAG TPA: hypothetical protein [virus sp. ctJrn16]
MWYDVDFTRWAVQLLPPILRSRVLVALLRIIIIPLAYLHRLFTEYRKKVAERLDITASVQDIERALNRRFFLRNRQIYIESESDDRHPCLYFQAESKPPTFLNPRMTLWMDGEVPSKPNFTIFVPSFLVSSLNSEEDRHHGRHLAEIIRIVERYKPAGRRYAITIYEYE